jgi:hypothetical protein
MDKLILDFVKRRDRRYITVDVDGNYETISTSGLSDNDIKYIINDLKLFIMELEDCLKENQ